MPRQLKFIDAIAREKQRDVLFIAFRSKADWRKNPRRQRVCQWLIEHQIAWEDCGPFADECCMRSYEGQIYVDVPYDVSISVQ